MHDGCREARWHVRCDVDRAATRRVIQGGVPMTTTSRRLAWTLAACALASSAPAQDPVIRTAEEPATLTANGTVISSSRAALVLRDDDGSRKTFVVDGESTLPGKVAKGDRVTVTYETKGKAMRAVSVAPTDAPPPTRPKARATRPPGSR